MLQSSLSYRPTRKGRAGFTLAELLIVVAIILVLVAIAVPVFTGLVGNSEEATCAANRRTVKSAFAASFTLDSSQDKDALFTQCVTSLKSAKQEKLCPSGGDYTPSFDANGNLTVQCSIHGISMDDEMYLWVQNTFKDNMSGYIGGTDLRKKYASDKHLTSWPEVKGTDSEPYYLQMKNYSNKPSAVFLYAGYESQISGGGNQWKARYVCDNTGLIGEPGQWYEVPEYTSVAMSDTPNSVGRDDMEALLKANESNKVVLVNGEFKPM